MGDKSGILSYIELDEKRYGSLIDRLLGEVAQQGDLSKEQQAAVRDYFALALSKGADFSSIEFAELAKMSPDALSDAAKNLPDKLSEKSRQAFAESGEQRPAAALWNSLFPDGKDDRIIALADGGKSIDDRLEDYIALHNGQAKIAYKKALEENPRDAGKTIEQREIRRDPDDMAKLQSFNSNPHRKQWEPAIKLGKFLEERMKWDLLDDFQLENSRKGENNADVVDADTRLLLERGENLDYYKRTHPSADGYKPYSLCILITRDPQKVGEMSSRQHWESCMRELGGINFHYVPKDIEAGTLAAYLVSMDDPQARYPLMRQLLKPYTNKYGETVLIPAKVYGADTKGNSRTKDALLSSLSNFVRDTVNDGKAGEFTMDTRLYGDGQPGFVALQTSWSKESIEQGLVKYHDSSLQEWGIELREREQKIERFKKYIPEYITQHEEEENIRAQRDAVSFRKKIANLQNPTELAKGFFRQTRKTSPDSLPDPALIMEVVKYPNIIQRSQAIGAVFKDHNIEKLEEYIAGIPQDERLEITRYVVHLLGECYTGKDDIVDQSLDLYKQQVLQLATPELRAQELASNFSINTKCNTQRHFFAEFLLEQIGELKSVPDRVHYAQRIFYNTEDENQKQAAADIVLQELKAPDSMFTYAYDIFVAVQQVVENVSNPVTQLQAIDILYNNMEKFSTPALRSRAAIIILDKKDVGLPADDERIKDALAILLKDGLAMNSAYQRDNALECLACFEETREQASLLKKQYDDLHESFKLLSEATNNKEPDEKLLADWVQKIESLNNPDWQLAALNDAVTKMSPTSLQYDDTLEDSAWKIKTFQMLSELAPQVTSSDQQIIAYKAMLELSSDVAEKSNIAEKMVSILYAEKDNMHSTKIMITLCELIDGNILNEENMHKAAEIMLSLSNNQHSTDDNEKRIDYAVYAIFSAQAGSELQNQASLRLENLIHALPDDDARIKLLNKIFGAVAEINTNPEFVGRADVLDNLAHKLFDEMRKAELHFPESEICVSPAIIEPAAAAKPANIVPVSVVGYHGRVNHPSRSYSPSPSSH